MSCGGEGGVGGGDCSVGRRSVVAGTAVCLYQQGAGAFDMERTGIYQTAGGLGG